MFSEEPLIASKQVLFFRSLLEFYIAEQQDKCGRDSMDAGLEKVNFTHRTISTCQKNPLENSCLGRNNIKFCCVGM